MIDIVHEINAMHRGALYVGPGWDGGLPALGLFLRGGLTDDPVKASGTATAEEIAAAAEISMAQFGGEALTGALRRTDNSDRD